MPGPWEDPGEPTGELVSGLHRTTAVARCSATHSFSAAKQSDAQEDLFDLFKKLNDPERKRLLKRRSKSALVHIHERINIQVLRPLLLTAQGLDG